LSALLLPPPIHIRVAIPPSIPTPALVTLLVELIEALFGPPPPPKPPDELDHEYHHNIRM
jgi:hypothetical protein